MDNGKHGEGSSSPSADLSIVSIELRGAMGDTAKVSLSTGSSFFISANFVIAESLCTGMPVDSDLFDKIEKESLYHEALRKALAFLSTRDHSAYEIRIKLLQRRFPESAIERTISHLRESRILDDYRFALACIESRMRKNREGYAALLAALLRKGVDRASAQKALQEAYTTEAELEAMRGLYDRLARRGGAEPERLAHTLAAKGFSWSRIREFMRDIGEDAEYEEKNY